MDYSTLNRLKDKLEQATSAIQAARISAEIEKEESRLKKEMDKATASVVAIMAQKDLLEKQIEIVQNQNQLLSSNYSKLEEMFNAQVEVSQEAKKELKRGKRFNLIMMIISIVAMLAAIAGTIATILVSK